MPTTLNSGLQLPDKGSVDWYSSMQTNYNLLDNHLENTDIHVTAEDKANWNSKQGSLSQAQLDAIAQVATNTSDIATLQSGKADASHTHSSSDITDIGDYATKQYVDDSISGLVDNAPAALDTLKELSTALNDDANFASTVTTALAAKANSADLATVATSGSYNDLSNKPTINDSTITIQKNGSTVDTFTTNGSNKTINIPVPTKTSDITNDSNFVDTSNSAVASGITSAKVTDYDTHIADTDIHVTTADKATWNTVTSKANDSDVVHKSGNETVGGIKSFSDDTYITSLNFTNEVPSPSSSSSSILPIITTITYGDSSPSVQARLNLRITADGVKSLYPHENNQYALGLTSRKWSEVHATTYYYGSSDVEFSNKFVTTDTNQNIGGNKTLLNPLTLKGSYILWKNNTVTKGTIPATSANIYRMYLGDAPNYGNSLFNMDCNVGNEGIQRFTIRSAENVVNGDDARLFVYYNPNRAQPRYVATRGNIEPYNSDTYECGTSVNRWSTFNGLNPSALSMPDLSNGIDISSYFDLSLYTGQTYTPTVNGWISISITSPNSGSILCESTGLSQTAYGVTDPDDNTKYRVSILIPCQKNQTLTTYIRASGGTINFAKFYPCQGNV